jgi:hypothetical protein
MTHSRLLYVPGMPWRPETFLPVRELASMATRLIDAGHATQVLDYGTLESFRRMASPGLRAAVRQTPDLAPLICRSGQALRRLLGVPSAQSYASLLHESLERRRHVIVLEIAAQKTLDFVVFWVETREDLREARQVAGGVADQASGIRRFLAGPYLRNYGAMVAADTDVFDGVLVADEERTLLALAERIHTPGGWGGVPNLVYRDGGRVLATVRRPSGDLDAPSYPRYDALTYPSVASGGKLRLFTVEQSRGLAQSGHRGNARAMENDGLSIRSAARVCAEMEYLQHHAGARAFHVSGQWTPSVQVEALAHLIVTRGLPVQYSRSGHVSCLNAGSAALLASSGAKAAGFQIDTGSQRLLEDFYGHPFGVSRAESVLGACRDAGLFTSARLTYPCPHDDYHTRAETLRLLQRSRPDAVSVAPPWIVPDSSWWSRAPDFGYQIDHGRYVRWVGAAAGVGRGDSVRVPFHMAGWPVSRSVAERASLERELREEGFLLGVSERLGLMARVAGYEGQETVFAAEVWQRLQTWDAPGLSELFREFNERALAPINTVPFRPFVPVLAAVGN